jgi:hypothetical protein
VNTVPGGGDTVEVHFHIGMIKANGVESSSALNVGTNILIGFSSSTKSTQGSGQNSGDRGSLPALLNLVDDRDEIDTPTWTVVPAGYAASPPFGSTPFPFPPVRDI